MMIMDMWASPPVVKSMMRPEYFSRRPKANDQMESLIPNTIITKPTLWIPLVQVMKALRLRGKNIQ